VKAGRGCLLLNMVPGFPAPVALLAIERIAERHRRPSRCSSEWMASYLAWEYAQCPPPSPSLRLC